MKILKCWATLMLIYLTITFAASENEILIHIQPMTRSQYESILKANNGKPVIPEGRLISSAITGITGFAAGFQISKYLSNLLGASNQNSKDSSVLSGYPLCRIITNAVTSRQNDANSNVNVDELTNSLVEQNGETNALPTMNCILVLDESKNKPLGEIPEQTITTSTIAKPTTMKLPTYYPPHHPSYPPHLHLPYHSPPPHLPYPQFYPGYPSYYPYPPPPFYLMPHPPYIKYPINDKQYDYEPEPEQNDDDEEHSSLESAVKLQTLIMNKLQAIKGFTTATMTTTTPTSTPNHPPHYLPQSKPKRQHFSENLDEFDDSIDYKEVSKKFHH